MELLITGTYAAWLGIIFIGLSILVIKQRASKRIGLGDGDDPKVQQVIRAHANFAEYVPIALILLAVAELNTNIGAYLHIPGGLLVLARLLQAYGLIRSSGSTKSRSVGVLMTFGVILGLAMLIIFSAYTR